MKTEYEFIYFELTGHKPKTDVYTCYAKANGSNLGEVKWYSQWRQYCFHHSDDTWNNGTCLADIKHFIDQLMEERKCQRKKKDI